MISTTPKQNPETKSNASQFYRFRAYQAVSTVDGILKRTNTVGMAYLREGQTIFTLRLWMFLNEKFYLFPHKADPTGYFVMTRELSRNPTSRSKYFWNIVGNGKVDSKAGCIQLLFDLLEKPIYLSLFPEQSSDSSKMQVPTFFTEVA